MRASSAGAWRKKQAKSSNGDRAGDQSSLARASPASLAPHSSRVVVVGSVNTDLVVRVRALPRPGETLSGQDFTVVGGGKGANAAVAAARMGAAVTLVACLGQDDFGATRFADLAREGLDLRHTRRSTEAASGVALITVDARGENTIVIAAGANALLLPENATAVALAPRDILLTQLEVPLATVEAALRHARDNGATALLNAAPYIPEAAVLLPLTDVLVVNEIEAADILSAGHVTPNTAGDAITALLARGPSAVAITLGEHGAVAGRGDERRHLRAPAVAAVDTTAAGDAFAGALAASLAEGLDFFVAAARAVIAGSLAVTKAGAQPSLPTRDKVEAFGGIPGGVAGG